MIRQPTALCMHGARAGRKRPMIHQTSTEACARIAAKEAALTAFLTKHFMETLGLERTARRIQHFSGPYAAGEWPRSFDHVRMFRRRNTRGNAGLVLLNQPYGYGNNEKPEPHRIFSLEWTTGRNGCARPITRPLFAMWLRDMPALHFDGCESFLYCEDWNVFRKLHGKAVHAHFAPHVLVDLRGWHPEPAAEMRALGRHRERVNRLEYAQARGFNCG